MDAKIKILFFASNPEDVTPLNLDEEIRSITTKIRASEYRDALDLISRWAVRPDDLLQELNIHKPTVVHFSGHGSSSGELVLMNDLRQAKTVSPPALKALFSTLKDNIRLVVLNACYSKTQADAIAQVIDCVIGMNTSIGDNAAIAFAASFYRAIGFGRSVKDSFDQGKVSLMLEDIPEENTPELLVRKDIDPASVYLVDVQGKEVVATRVLTLATDALNSLHELDNAIRLTVGPLTRFEPDWSCEKREETIKQMEILADKEVILPKVRQSIARLEKARGSVNISSEGAKAADVVLACGRKTLETLGESMGTPWPGPRELASLVSDVRTARSLEAAQRVKEQAEKVNNVVDRKILKDADFALGHN